jgi:hypothetical protein
MPAFKSDLARSETFEELLERVRSLPPMTDDQRAKQAMSFAYGNLACSTHHKPVRAAFAAVARRYGWSGERFERWAADKEWATLE